jgi:hypothetical protein
MNDMSLILNPCWNGTTYFQGLLPIGGFNCAVELKQVANKIRTIMMLIPSFEHRFAIAFKFWLIEKEQIFRMQYYSRLEKIFVELILSAQKPDFRILCCN